MEMPPWEGTDTEVLTAFPNAKPPSPQLDAPPRTERPACL